MSERKDALELAAELRRSDRAYFAAAACHERVRGGIIHWMPGLQHLAAGCIVEPSLTDAPFHIFAADVSDFLRSIGSTLFRFYMPPADGRLEDSLTGAGFRQSIELAIVRRIPAGRYAPELDGGLSIRRVQSAADWLVKAGLAAAIDSLPDGKAADPSEWTDLERRKAQDGYGSFWIVELEGRACGTFGLSPSGRLLRLKNLAVHPAFRRHRVATGVIDFALTHAAANGFEWLGAFAIAGGAGERFYHACRFDVVGAQTEWSRPLAPAQTRRSAALPAPLC